MLLLRIIPREQFVFRTTCSRDEVILKLAEQTAEPPIFRVLKPESFFEGHLTENTFRIWRAHYWGRGNPPILEGEVSSAHDGAIIHVISSPGLLGWVWLALVGLFFLVIVCRLPFLLLGGGDGGIAAESGGLVIGLLLSPAMVALMLCDFWRNAEEAKQVLKDIVLGEEA